MCRYSYLNTGSIRIVAITERRLKRLRLRNGERESAKVPAVALEHPTGASFCRLLCKLIFTLARTFR
jgi:hypothetical protein